MKCKSQTKIQDNFRREINGMEAQCLFYGIQSPFDTVDSLNIDS